MHLLCLYVYHDLQHLGVHLVSHQEKEGNLFTVFPLRNRINSIYRMHLWCLLYIRIYSPRGAPGFLSRRGRNLLQFCGRQGTSEL